MTNGTNVLLLAAVAVVAGGVGFFAGTSYEANRQLAIAETLTETSAPATAAPVPVETEPAANVDPPPPPAAPVAVAEVPPPPAEVPATPPVVPDPWEVSEGRSEIDDSPRVLLITRSEERVNRYGRLDRASLVIRCLENETNFYINADEFLGSDGIRVTIRIDDAKAVTNSWSISTDHKAMFAGDAIGLSRKLLGKSSLTVRFTPYSESPVTLKFDVTQLDKHLPKVAAACGWKL
jgi:type VI secretion system protein VasI